MILIPCTAINETITGWEGKEINPVIRSNAKLFSKIEVNLSESAIRLPDQKGDRDWVDNDASYIPQDVDRRETVERQIRERRGQQQFRDALRARYGDRCLVTGCDVLAVLEAAHIKPYRGKDDHHPENGLLLRSDIHTLFDLDLLGIEPDRMQIELHPNLADDEEYAKLGDKTLSCERDQHPSHEALRIRYEQFKKRVHRAGMRFPPLVGPPNK
ncbi:MAG: HNH endonuclease [Desulfobacteraceae bacterium]|nr:HNH endonuclease [Desulfobacteraceae bacterium]